MILKKYVENNIVVVLTGLPNLAITASTITIATTFFHVFPLWAYLLGQVFSVQYAVIYSMLVKSNFKAFGREYHFRDKKDIDRDSSPERK